MSPLVTQPAAQIAARHNIFGAVGNRFQGLSPGRPDRTLATTPRMCDSIGDS